jgi:hypothetical protein
MIEGVELHHLRIELSVVISITLAGRGFFCFPVPYQMMRMIDGPRCAQSSDKCGGTTCRRVGFFASTA